MWHSKFCWKGIAKVAMTNHRKSRGFRTERVVISYLQTWWRSASVGRGAGKDIHNVPFDIEIKARSEFSPLAWIKQVEKRAAVPDELPIVVCRMNGQGEDASQYLAFMRFSDLVGLLLKAGYGDIQTDSDKLEPERCAQCGSWKLVNVPCRTCK
jgi:hypothetical protein